MSLKKISDELKSRKTELAELIMRRQFTNNPGLSKHYNDTQKERSIQDTEYHLLYLAEAVFTESERLFTQYLIWVKQLLKGYNVSEQVLIENLNCLKEVLSEEINGDRKEIINKITQTGINELSSVSDSIPSFLTDENPLLDLAREYLNLILKTKSKKATSLILDVVNNQYSAKELYLNVFQPVQYEIGRLWQLNDISVAQEHYCTSVTQLVISQLYPYILNNSNNNGLTCITTCIGNELHEMGIRMVADFLEMDGWNTIHLGANTPINSIIETLIQQEADLIGISVTMTFHLERLTELISKIKANGAIRKLKILVGGYVFNLDHRLWEKVGADGFAENASQAVMIAESFFNNDVKKNG